MVARHIESFARRKPQAGASASGTSLRRGRGAHAPGASVASSEEDCLNSASAISAGTRVPRSRTWNVLSGALRNSSRSRPSSEPRPADSPRRGARRPRPRTCAGPESEHRPRTPCLSARTWTRQSLPRELRLQPSTFGVNRPVLPAFSREASRRPVDRGERRAHRCALATHRGKSPPSLRYSRTIS